MDTNRLNRIDYVFEIKQECKFEVLDDDGGNSFDFVGECFTTIGAIVGSKNNVYISQLKAKNNQVTGNIVILSEAQEECRDYIFMQWKGIKLANTDGWFSKSDPFLRFKRVREDKNEILCHETEVIMENLNPVWRPFEISGQILYNGDTFRPIKVECWDWEKSQVFQFIGETQFNMNELVYGKREFELIDKKKKKEGNTQLNVILAVDFTASNGSVSTPQSLHFLQQNCLNQYQQAIISVGEILLDYDFDKRVPCFGFGGHPKFPNMFLNGVSHCFPLSGNPSDVEACGMSEMLNLYQYALQNVSLSGPTLFNPLLQETLKVTYACKQQGSQIYTVLLIITDGEIHDMQDTINSLVLGSDQPLSVIIVGVGSADFTNMNKLDGDGCILTDSKGRKATRDIVQFVPFRNFQGNPAILAKEVLAEVPDQLVKYMCSQGIKPQEPQQVNMSQFQLPVNQVGNNAMQFGVNLLNQGGYLNEYQHPLPPVAGNQPIVGGGLPPFVGGQPPVGGLPQFVGGQPPVSGFPQFVGGQPPNGQQPQYVNGKPPVGGLQQFNQQNNQQYNQQVYAQQQQGYEQQQQGYAQNTQQQFNQIFIQGNQGNLGQQQQFPIQQSQQVNFGQNKN
ncbi:hypothetical protein IMG5_115500 [Ichthyophthirius multifiliis]|uniref:C2 domain-containing protein n=1 Tax=Ichthyophthirius multifiliis TaxID=5932 RepID=G0QU80_ICHMU|nr:hypothetical protein IMG5_115500 [Ichthyophthirius multifiliis]EGR31217.1 hypothetical protein IMG5_115500 [Ichthyophthirius multifiliis]|eukprot:XP_004034703.1 hypothetical protein IMG5_115500 [Ichthyophthirius multifiliis]